MSKKIILVDMDEVLCDFIGGACRIHGQDPAEIDEKRLLGVWSVQDLLAISLHSFWAPINREGESFWFNLEPTPWFQQVVDACNRTGCEWHVVTAPSRDLGTYTGKIKWLRQRLGDDFDRFHITRHKHVLAGPNRVLIDDREENLDKFIAQGGKGVIFPTKGNSLYSLRSNPVFYLEIKLRELCNFSATT